jgi:hypothetical protein
MSALDSLLIAWWPLTAVTGALVYAYVNWIRDPTAIAWSLSVDQDRQQVLQTTLTRPVYLAIGVAVTISVVITTVGLLAFFVAGSLDKAVALEFPAPHGAIRRGLGGPRFLIQPISILRPMVSQFTCAVELAVWPGRVSGRLRLVRLPGDSLRAILADWRFGVS